MLFCFALIKHHTNRTENLTAMQMISRQTCRVHRNSPNDITDHTSQHAGWCPTVNYATVKLCIKAALKYKPHFLQSRVAYKPNSNRSRNLKMAAQCRPCRANVYRFLHAKMFSDKVRCFSLCGPHQCSALQKQLSFIITTCLDNKHLQNKCRHLTMPEFSKTPVNR